MKIDVLQKNGFKQLCRDWYRQEQKFDDVLLVTVTIETRTPKFTVRVNRRDEWGFFDEVFSLSDKFTTIAVVNGVMAYVAKYFKINLKLIE